jgi:hypothetical protein
LVLTQLIGVMTLEDHEEHISDLPADRFAFAI